MTPIITNLLAETRHHERMAATQRHLARRPVVDGFAAEPLPVLMVLRGRAYDAASDCQCPDSAAAS